MATESAHRTVDDPAPVAIERRWIPPDTAGAAATAGTAAVVGAGGGIGAALLAQLRADRRHAQVLAIGRQAEIPLDLCDESSIAAAAKRVAAVAADAGAPLRLVIVATGVLQCDGVVAEKSWRELDGERLARTFAINTIGPALVIKHFLPLFPRPPSGTLAAGESSADPSGDAGAANASAGRAVFAVLSAKVGSIGDNRLGGWYGYRASKAALNQVVRCAAIELRRSRPQAVCVALHPGTVDTELSRPFAKSGLEVRTPADAARRLLAVIDGLRAEDSGSFFDPNGAQLPW